MPLVRSDSRALATGMDLTAVPARTLGRRYDGETIRPMGEVEPRHVPAPGSGGMGQPCLKATAVARPRTGRWLADPVATEHGRQAARSVVVRVGHATMLGLHPCAAAGGVLIP
jgi:hypothetical protein